MILRCLFATILCAPLAAAAQFSTAWQKPPKIVVIGAEGDPRMMLVDEAIGYWNRALEDAGAGFRLPAAARAALPIPEEALQELSRAMLAGRGPVHVPPALRELPGDLSVVLAQS